MMNHNTLLESFDGLFQLKVRLQGSISMETTAGLNCEREYSFQIVARDSNSQPGVLNIVEDINANSAQFDSPKYMFKVILGRIAGTVSANDKNADLNFLVTFSTVTVTLH